MKKTLSITVLLASLLLNGCGTKNTIEDKNIVVGASTTPHAEILKEAEAYIKSKGYSLEIVEFDDYILPNEGVSDGSLDANYFQHLPYLEDYNKEKGTNIVNAGKIHFEPLSVYSKTETLVNVKKNAAVGIPNDTTNGGRALKLLESLGLIELDQTKGNLVTKNDITSNPHNFQIIEFKADILPAQLADLDYAVINGNYALSSGVIEYLLPNSSEDSSSEGASTYANIIACQSGNENSEAIKILLESLRQDNIKQFIEETYKGTVLYFEG